MSTQIDQVEKALEELITAHGADKVRADLNALLPRGRWADWQQLVNLTQNIERRQLREKGPNNNETKPKTANQLWAQNG